MKKIRVLIVDDNSEFLSSAERFLGSVPSIEVIGSMNSAKEIQKRIQELRPDVVLMDVSMPYVSGFTAARDLKKLARAPRIIIVSMHKGVEYGAAAIAAGADAFVTKSEINEKLLPLIESFFSRESSN